MKRGLMILFILIGIQRFAGGQVLVYESFEGTAFPPNGWTVINNGSGNDWAQNTNASFAASGTKSLMYSFTSSAPAATWAFTPAIQLDSADSITITFDQRVGLSNLTEALKVTVGNAQTVASQTTVLYNNNNLTNIVFTARTATFIANATGSYYFAFNCFSAADQYKLYIDNIRIAKPILKDASIVSLSIAQTGCALSASEPVSIVVKNSGADSIGNFAVNYSINGLSPVSEIVSSPIAPGNSLSYTFAGTADLSATGSYTIKAYTSLTNDDDPYNDTLTQQTEHIIGGLTVKSSEEIVLIPDNSPAGADSPILFCGLPANLNGTTFALDYLEIDSINHGWISDLSIYLVSPSNQSILISAGNGGNSSNIAKVVFTDSASINVGTISSGGLPAGFYHTESPTGLAAFNTGQNPNGSWKLKVVDNLTGDAGKICKWTLAFKGYTAITEHEEAFDFEVYPNPTENQTTIHLKNIKESATIKLTTVSGQLVYNKTTTQKGSYTTQLQMREYGKGIYFIQVVQEKQTTTRKIVVY